jgi:hypothetical protein
MKKDKEQQQQPNDPNLDIPAESNRTKHINFMDVEDESATKTGINNDDWAADRQKQWKKGLQEGREAFENNE